VRFKELFLAICPKNGKSIKEISDDSLQIFREGPIIKQYRLSSDKTTVIPVDLPALNIQRINLTEGEITIFAKGVKEDFALTMLKSFFFIPGMLLLSILLRLL
jgi:hypothetical protein